MAKIKVGILSAAECERRSVGTDPFTEGWWYHGTSYGTAKAILDRKQNLDRQFWLTKNPQGASQCKGTTVLRCRVQLRKSKPPKPGDDRYNTKDGDEGLDLGYKWIGVIEGHVFIDRDCLSGAEDGSQTDTIPTVGEELERIMDNADNGSDRTGDPQGGSDAGQP